MKKKIIKKYNIKFKKNPFVKKWKEKLVILILILLVVANLFIFSKNPTVVELLQEYQN